MQRPRPTSGPAIGVDLASSPAGKGNSAKGNSLNAIAVPSGTIRSQVIWGMVGIPYLVQRGLIQIGQATLSIQPYGWLIVTSCKPVSVCLILPKWIIWG